MSSKKAEEEKQRDERIEQTGQLTLESTVKMKKPFI